MILNLLYINTCKNNNYEHQLNKFLGEVLVNYIEMKLIVSIQLLTVSNQLFLWSNYTHLLWIIKVFIMCFLSNPLALEYYQKQGLWEVDLSILGNLRQTQFLCFFYTDTTGFDIKPYFSNNFSVSILQSNFLYIWS